MATLKKRVIIKQLKKKGFRHEKKVTHHETYYLFANDKKTSVYTYFSHGISDYGEPLIAAVADQLKLSKKQLLDFVDCRLSGEAYLNLLVDAGHVVIQR